MSGFGRSGRFNQAAPQQHQQQQTDYNTSPAAFSGTQQEGGFISTQDSPSHGAAATPSKQRSAPIVQTLTPVTIRQLYKASQAHPDDVFKVDNKELNQITLVGQIVFVQVQSTNVELEIDDSTGKMSVRMWLELEDDPQGYAAKQRENWRVGTYVRVIGHLRSFMNNRNVVAFRIQPVSHADEITYHLLDVINVHLYNTRGPLEGGGAAAASGEQHTDHSDRTQAAHPRQGAYGQSASRVRSKFTEVQKAVLEVIATSSQPKTGCAVSFVCDTLRNLAPESDIRSAIEFLNGEGHLYSTIDEEHYRCADDH